LPQGHDPARVRSRRLPMSVRRIIETFDAWRRHGEPMVLATVYDTLGSTYSKAGHRILIAANGDYQGLVSGGCLEGDLAERAREVLKSGAPVAITYDLRDEADDLWGLGVGCNGLIRVFLQPLHDVSGYQPFTAICRRLLDNRPAVVATVIESQRADLVAGATVLWSAGSLECFGADATACGELASGCESAGIHSGARLVARDGLLVLYAPLLPVPRLLVLGAGLDAVPLVRMAAELGWRVTVADHRPAYLARGGFEAAEQVLAIEPGELAGQLQLDLFDGVLVMSHHLATDRTYLAQLVDVPARYLGVLGPPARRARLIADLGAAGERIAARLKGPVGIDIGANSPESIALSVLAELHATLRGRNAVSLTSG
jgi:xanthine dehydrogenase accessory factor